MTVCGSSQLNISDINDGFNASQVARGSDMSRSRSPACSRPVPDVRLCLILLRKIWLALDRFKIYPTRIYRIVTHTKVHVVKLR